MNAVNRPLELTSRQKWLHAGLGAALLVALFTLMAGLGSTDIDENVGTILIFIGLGLVAGFAVRLGTKHGWCYYAAKYQPGTQYIFTKELKRGVLWRSLAAWFGGRCAIVLLTRMVDSDAGVGLMFLAGSALMIAAALMGGLRFGWQTADKTLSDAPVAAAT